MSKKQTKPTVTTAPESGTLNPLLIWLPLSLILGWIGFKLAYELRWFGDDCFITLRYIDNWFAGKGLVYNEGERVEGYTHFLWMLLVSFFKLLGANTLQAALQLGLVCYVCTLVVMALTSLRLQSPYTNIILPFGLLALVTHHHFNAFATSGLETMMFTLWLALLLFTLFFSKWTTTVKLLLSSIWMVCLLLTRPDGALVFLLINLLLLTYYLLKHSSFRKVFVDGLIFNLPVLLLFIPFLLWRLSYYGSLVPNTYYAKAGYFNQWDKGYVFLSQYFHVYGSSWLWVPALVVLLLVLLGRNSGLIKLRQALISNKPLQYGCTLAAILGVYVVGFVWKVGGDFMFSRFMIPMVPVMYGMAEVAVVAFWQKEKIQNWKLPATMALLSVVYLFWHQKDEQTRLDFTTQRNGDQVIYKINDNIVDERLFYKDLLPRVTYWGKFLAPYFEGLPAVVLNSGQCAFTYHGRFATVIEKFGLTDSTIAHSTIREEDLGRIGHSKAGTYEYFLQRGVHFSFYRSPYVGKEYRFCQFILPDGSGLRAEMFIFDKLLVRELKRRMGESFQFVNAEQLVDQIIRDFDRLPEEEKKTIFDELDTYYFRVNKDIETQAQRERLEELTKAYRL
jgi:hypothetical protein